MLDPAIKKKMYLKTYAYTLHSHVPYNIAFGEFEIFIELLRNIQLFRNITG
jgi:hypothetical protein